MSVYYITGWKTREEYLSYMNSKDFNHNAHFSPRRTFYPVSPEPNKQINGRLHIQKKKNTHCSKLCALVWFLVFFIVLSIVMTSLFIWQVQRISQGEVAPTAQQQSREDTAGCLSLPKPVELKTLPKRLDTELKAIENLIEKMMDGQNGTTNGIGALTANLVYRDKVIWNGAFGVVDRSEKVPRKPSSSTVFPCASVSKVLTALAMYKLYDEKLIKSLDEPISNLDADFKINNPFNNHKITLKDLASMRSGVQREAPCYPSSDKNLCPYSQKTMTDRIQNLSLLVEPNTLSQYSNFGYGLLGNVLAKNFSQGDFNSLVERYVLKPLKMDESTFFLQKSQVKNIPVAYDTLGKKKPVSEWGWLNPAGGLFSTINDLSKLEIELMDDRNTGRYLSKAVTDQLFSTMHILPDGKSMTGIPWEMKIHDGIVYRDKGGAVYGYNAMMSMVPELRLAFNIMCTNCRPTYQGIVKESFEKRIVPTMIKELRKAYKKKFVLPPDYQIYVGHYSTNDVPLIKQMDVEVHENKLMLLVNRSPMFYLNYTSGRSFRMSVMSEVTVCSNAYTLASENDRVLFDQVSSKDGLSHGFVLFNAEPSGRSYFYRNTGKTQ